CVFDKNNHGDYDEALNKIRKMRSREDVFHAKVSVPSFEYYLLLHYEYTASPCTSAQALSRLKKHIKGYTKGKKGIFAIVYGNLETAKSNARKSLTAARKNGWDNPLTEAHELVEFMQKMTPD
ncbi:MAG: RloB family protein, partial [Gammaproteobacteria bacterium]|nr:RloB family protein [Gammaproteobacteria bacterium]